MYLSDFQKRQRRTTNMGGRRAISAKLLTTEKTHYANEDLEERIEAEPVYQSQIFAVPKEIADVPEEVDKWNELADLIRSIENSPNSDADKDTMINYCKAWVRFIKTDKRYQSEPDDKDNYKQMMDNAKLLAKLKSDLMLDCVSRAKIGKARIDHKKKNNAIEDIYNRQGK